MTMDFYDAQFDEPPPEEPKESEIIVSLSKEEVEDALGFKLDDTQWHWMITHNRKETT